MIATQYTIVATTVKNRGLCFPDNRNYLKKYKTKVEKFSKNMYVFLFLLIDGGEWNAQNRYRNLMPAYYYHV
jgi:hypothetical protein